MPPKLATGIILLSIFLLASTIAVMCVGCERDPKPVIENASPSVPGPVNRLPVSPKTCTSTSGSTVVHELTCAFTRPAAPGDSIKCSLIFDEPVLSDSGGNSYQHDLSYYSENITSPASTVTMILPHPQNFAGIMCSAGVPEGDAAQ